MKKWQEIGFTSIANFAVALMVAGIVSIVLEHKDIIGAVSLICSGIYLLGYGIIHAKQIEDE